MGPIELLNAEHRLIERAVSDMSLRLNRFVGEKALDIHYVETVTDFIRTYAEECHHGKEETILFRELRKKKVDPELKRVMNELIAEHQWAHLASTSLVELATAYSEGRRETFASIERVLQELLTYYPAHMHKEQDYFFVQSMTYLSDEEQAEMVREFIDFDQKLLHTKYRKQVEALEAGGVR